MDWSQCSVVEANENIVGGAPVIIGTRIPLSAVFENLEGGATISEIVEWFPGITEVQIREILRFAANSAAA